MISLRQVEREAQQVCQHKSYKLANSKHLMKYEAAYHSNGVASRTIGFAPFKAPAEGRRRCTQMGERG